MYPVDGNGIPRLYVIRADGEKLYAAVGSLAGDMLPQMMLATIQQAGRSFSDADAMLLENAVTSAKSMLDQGNRLGAASALSAVTKFGSPDDFGSFAEPAITAGELYQQLLSAIDEQVKEAETMLAVASADTDPLDSIIAIYEAEACYKLFPKLKSKAATLTRNLKKQSDYAETLSQADSLVKARLLASSINPRLRSRAPAAYTSVIRRFPTTRVDKLARAELAEIEPEAKILQTNSDVAKPITEFRKWTARTGNFSTTAKYLQHAAGKVQLQKLDGKRIVVDIPELSDEDQAYLRTQ